jgi:hypothetical protein
MGVQEKQLENISYRILAKKFGILKSTIEFTIENKKFGSQESVRSFSSINIRGRNSHVVVDPHVYPLRKTQDTHGSLKKKKTNSSFTIKV